MKKRAVTTQEYIIEPDEVPYINQILKYCLHRLIDHPESGIKKIISETLLRKLINDLE